MKNININFNKRPAKPLVYVGHHPKWRIDGGSLWKKQLDSIGPYNKRCIFYAWAEKMGHASKRSEDGMWKFSNELTAVIYKDPDVIKAYINLLQ
jgi:hypothetical protein